MQPFLDLMRAGRLLTLVCHAHPLLARHPDAPGLARLTLRALVELGWCGPARELLALRRDLPIDNPETAELARRAAAGPNGRVLWTDLASVLAGNLTELRRRHPALAEAARGWASRLGGWQLHRSVRGDFQPSWRKPGALREWGLPFSTLDDEPRLALPARGALGATAVIGLRHGGLIRALFERTADLLHGASFPMLLIEPDEVLAGAWLHCDDHVPLLRDERTMLFVGPGALDRMAAALRADVDLPLPTHVVNLSGDAALAAQVDEVLQRELGARERELEQLQADLASRYHDRDVRYWAKRWARPGTVLGLTSRFTTVLQHSMRDALAALEGLGWRTHLVIEGGNHQRVSPIRLARTLLETDPDLVLMLDHLRYEQPLLPVGVPLLCWIQDPMPNLLCRRAGESIGPLDFVCGFYRPRCTAEFGYPPERFLFVNVPVSTRVFHDAPVPAAEHAARAADICFVSHASRSLNDLHADALRDHPEETRPLVSRLYERVCQLLDQGDSIDLQTSAASLVRESAAACGLRLDPAQFEHFKTHVAYRFFDWGRRQQTLEWVAGWARRTGRVLRIYGKGWERHPLLAEFACGPLGHGEPLRRAYRCATLALQLLPSGFLHQRSFEALAAGALPLTRYCPDSDDFGGETLEAHRARKERGEPLLGTSALLPDLEQVVFRTADEFERLAERFLCDVAERERVLGALRSVVLERYTYDAVMKRVTDEFRKQMAVSAAGSGPDRSGAPRRPARMAPTW
jgi:hypothetical protein